MKWIKMRWDGLCRKLLCFIEKSRKSGKCQMTFNRKKFKDVTIFIHIYTNI